MNAATSLAESVVEGLGSSPVLLFVAVVVVTIAGLATFWLILSRRYHFSYKTEKSHIELKPADPPEKKR